MDVKFHISNQSVCVWQHGELLRCGNNAKDGITHIWPGCTAFTPREEQPVSIAIA
jgi:hypothetical protein